MDSVGESVLGDIKMKKAEEKLTKQEKQEQRKEKRERIKWLLQSNKENICFVLLNLLFAVMIIGAIIVSVFDKLYDWLNWDANAIGVLCQIITAIVAFFASTIGIAITLQKEECWGISVKEFNNLRVGLKYPIVVFITLAITLSALNAGFYVAKLIIASIGVAVVAILFCIYVAWCEIPLMVKSERFLLKTIKCRLWREWKSPNDLSKDLKEVLKFLIADSKNLNNTFEVLKSKNKEFNKFLILKLLELQSDLASELKQIESKQRQLKVASSLLVNSFSLITFSFNLTEILGDEFLRYDYYVSRVLFQLKEIPEYKNRTTSLIADSLTYLKYDDYTETQIKFIMSIVLSMVTISIRNGDFSFVKALQEKFSIGYYDLGQDNYASVVFVLVSMQFYFLCHDSQNASEQLKKNIREYLEYSDIVNHTKVYSWKNLFSHFSHDFKVNFTKFMYYFSASEKSWDVPIYFECQWVQLDREYALYWYLTQLLNSYASTEFDFTVLCLDEHCKFYLKKFGDKSFDENKKFIVSEKMESILKFYDIEKEPLHYFLSMEERTHNLFEFINTLRKEDLRIDATKAESKKNEEIANKYKEAVVSAIQSEWGFDPSVEITSDNKAMAILIEKSSCAINYEEVMTDTLIKSVFHELRSNITPKIIKKDVNFEKELDTILKDNFAYISKPTQYIKYFIKDSSTQKAFDIICKHAISFESRILFGDVLVKDRGFAFNLEITECSARDLSVEEISEEAEKYKRADGQYVYEGAFLSREEIEQYVGKKYAILKIALKYQVQWDENSIVEIQLY